MADIEHLDGLGDTLLDMARESAEVVNKAYDLGRASGYRAGQEDMRAECVERARLTARAISKGTHGRLGSIEAIGDKIANAIVALPIKDAPVQSEDEPFQAQRPSGSK